MILFKFKIDIMLELISSSNRHMILCEKRRRQRTSQESESDKGKKTKSMSSWSILLQALGSSGIGRKNEKGAKRPLPLRGSGPSGTSEGFGSERDFEEVREAACSRAQGDIGGHERGARMFFCFLCSVDLAVVRAFVLFFLSVFFGGGPGGFSG